MLSLTFLILGTDPEIIKYTEKPITVIVYIDDSRAEEKMLGRLLKADSIVECVSANVINMLGLEAVQKACAETDARLKRIKTNFIFEIKDRYLARAPFSIQLGLRKPKLIISTLDFHSMIQLVDFYIDEDYYYMEKEVTDKLQSKLDNEWYVNDCARRFSFVAKLEMEGKKISSQYIEYPPYVLFEHIGKLKTIEELGYVPLPKEVITCRPQTTSPIIDIN